MGFALSSVTRPAPVAPLFSAAFAIDEGVPRWRQRAKGSGVAQRRIPPSCLDPLQQRQGRELLKLRGRTQEIQRLIGRSLRAAIDMAALGERTRC